MQEEIRVLYVQPGKYPEERLRCTPEQYAQQINLNARRDTPEPELDER